MKKVLKWGCIIAAALTALVLLAPNPIHYRLYPFSRIRGTVQVTVDGEVYDLDESNFVFTHSSDNRTGKVKVSGKNVAKVSYRANKYGRYDFEIADTPVGKPITVSVYQANWWDVHRFTLKVSVDTAAKTADYDMTLTELEENGFITDKNHFTEKQDYTQEDCRIGFGP